MKQELQELQDLVAKLAVRVDLVEKENRNLKARVAEVEEDNRNLKGEVAELQAQQGKRWGGLFDPKPAEEPQDIINHAITQARQPLGFDQDDSRVVIHNKDQFCDVMVRYQELMGQGKFRDEHYTPESYEQATQRSKDWITKALDSLGMDGTDQTVPAINSSLIHSSLALILKEKYFVQDLSTTYRSMGAFASSSEFNMEPIQDILEFIESGLLPEAGQPLLGDGSHVKKNIK